jgi:hypothetical protein
MDQPDVTGRYFASIRARDLDGLVALYAGWPRGLAPLKEFDRLSDLFDCLVDIRWNFNLSTFGNSLLGRLYQVWQPSKIG